MSYDVAPVTAVHDSDTVLLPGAAERPIGVESGAAWGVALAAVEAADDADPFTATTV